MRRIPAWRRPLLEPAGEARSVDDWFVLPDRADRFELHDGMLVLAPPPGLDHQSYVSYVCYELQLYARKHGGIVMPLLTGVALSPVHGYQPDALYLRKEHADRLVERGIEGPPDLVVEILSPATRHYDLTWKLPAYLEHGVEEVWIVDPVARTVAVHRADHEPEVVEFGKRIPSRIVKVKDGGLGDMKLPKPGQAE